MPSELFTTYGAVCKEDIQVIEASVSALLPRDVVRVLEIGAYEGQTGAGIKRFLEANGSKIAYWGIDPGLLGKNDPPFEGATTIKGTSEESFHLVPDEFDFIFVDGNHSRNSVMLDILNYEPKVVPGGFMLFHDTSPTMQGQDYQYHGPKIPEFHVAVLAAFELVGWPWHPWTKFMESVPTDDNRYGTHSYRKGQ